MQPMMQLTLIGIAAFLEGLFAGLASWYRAKARAQVEATDLKVRIASLEEEARATAADRLRWAEEMEQRMRDDFQALVRAALQSNAEILDMRIKKNIQTAIEPLCDRLRSQKQLIR